MDNRESSILDQHQWDNRNVLVLQHLPDPSQGIYRGQPVHIIDESRTGGVYHRVFDDESYYPSCSAAYIFARQPVLINVGVGLHLDGHSDYGIADVDFSTQLPGINNRISVPSIEVSHDPFVIL